VSLTPLKQACGSERLLDVRDVSVSVVPEHGPPLRILERVSLDIRPGETVALVGESGSGKSTLGRAILGLRRPYEGSITYHGGEVSQLTGRASQRAREKMQVVFQDPYSSLNPRRSVGYSLGQPLRRSPELTKTAVQERIAASLSEVGLPADAAGRYPAEFSGGQRQRIAIARALIGNPDLVVCDEPVSALDLSIQAQILNLLMTLRQKKGMAYLFIAHSIPVVRHIANRIVVLYRGHVVESGPAERVIARPEHPYTQALLDAAPVPDPRRQAERRHRIRPVQSAPASETSDKKATEV
jgi:ABC-type oligopeptide transport system ATPase subunit